MDFICIALALRGHCQPLEHHDDHPTDDAVLILCSGLKICNRRGFMKALSFFFISLFTASISWADPCPTLQNHPTYVIDEEFFAVGSDFDIKAGDKNIGEIVERVIRVGKTFELHDERGRLVAKARKQIVSWGVKIDISDCNDQPIGRIQENVISSLFKIHTVYSIFDGRGELVGQSKKLDLVGTDIAFYNASEKTVATLTRPYINILTDKWTLSISTAGQMDPRLLFFTAAYKTAADNERKAEEKKKKAQEKERSAEQDRDSSSRR